MKILVVFTWGLVAADGLLAIAGLVTRNMGDDAAGRGVATTFGLISLALVAGAATLLYFSSRSHSWVGVAFSACLLGLPLLFIFGTSATSALQELKYRIAESRTGRYKDPRQRQLAQAIRAGDLDGMRRILALKPALDGRDPIDYDLLSYSIALVRERKGTPDAVRLLLEAGMNPNQSRFPNGSGLLDELTYSTEPVEKAVFRMLLEHGADPNAPGRQTARTPLCATEDPDLVKLLVEHGADVNAMSPSGTPLIHNILTSHWDNAVYLIEHDADVNLADREGTTPSAALQRFVRDDLPFPDGAQRVKDALGRKAAR